MTYCNDKGIPCEFANLNGFCSVSACYKTITLIGGTVLVGQTEKIQLPMTNADRIRAMSDKDLATLLCISG